MKNSIHEYFRKEVDGYLILVQVDPNSLRGLELIISPDKKVRKSKRTFDPEIYDDLSHDNFTASSPLEFNLYLKGISN